MKFSRIICGTALVVIGSLVLVSAGQYGSNYNSHRSALTHYGGGAGCHGHGCYNQVSAPMSSAHGAYGPYHSYAVRPAVYGGHGLYTYKGYARHHPAPAAHYRHPRSYSMAAPSRHYGGCRGYNCGARGPSHYAPAATYKSQSNNYGNNDNHHQASYGLKPVKMFALIHSNNYAAPAYGHNQSNQNGHYRAARSAYGHAGYGAPARHQQQSYGNNHDSPNYGGSAHHAGRQSYGHAAGNAGY